MTIENLIHRVKRLGNAIIQFIGGFIDAIIQSIVVPIFIYFTYKQPAIESVEEYDPHELQPDIRNVFSHAIKELEREGFELVSYCVSRGQVVWEMPNNTYLAVMKNRKKRDMAAVMWPQYTPPFVEFSTEWEYEGKRKTIETSNNPQIGPFHKTPDKHTYRFPHIHSLHRLYLLHRERVQKHAARAEIIFPKDGTEMQEIQRAGVKDLEGQTKVGYLSFDPSSGIYRPTWKGACMMTWKQIGLIQTCLRMAIARREKVLLKQFFTDQLHLKSCKNFPKPKTIAPLIHVTNNTHWIGQDTLANALRKIQHAHTISPLIEALEENDWLIREVAIELLERTGLPLIELLIQTMLTGRSEALQKKAAQLLHPLVAIDTVILGQRSSGASTQDIGLPYSRVPDGKDCLAKKTHMVLENPDVSICTIGLSELKTIVVYIASYDFYEIERFLTYSINYIGKKRLKKHVVVHLYGAPEHLHPNLLNNFINLCKNVYIHNEDETLIPEKSIRHENEDS